MVSPIHGEVLPQLSGVSSTGLSGINSTASGFLKSGISGQIFDDTLSNLALTDGGKLTLFPANNPRIPQPSLFSIMQTESQATALNEQEAYSNSTAIDQMTASFYHTLVSSAEYLYQLLSELDTLIREITTLTSTLNNDISNENSQIASYNSNVASDNANMTTIRNAASTFNAAYNLYQTQTQEYNSGIIPGSTYAADTATFNTAQGTYNSAVATYDAYYNSRTPEINSYNSSVNSFNTQVGSINNQINTINQQLEDLGINPLPLEFTLASAPSLPQVSTSPPAPVTVPSISLEARVSPFNPYVTVISTLTTLAYADFNALVTLNNQTLLHGLQITQNTRQFIDFFLPTKNADYALPATFKSENTKTNTTTIGVNSNTGLAAISGGLDPAISRRLFNQGAQNAYFVATTSVLKPGTIDAVVAANGNALALASLVNGQRLLQNFRDSLTSQDLDSSVSDNALAIGLVGSIVDITSRNVLGQALQNLGGPNENNPAAQTVLNGLSSTINLSNLGSILGLLSSTLQLPGLSGQLLGLAGLNNSELFNLTSQGNGFNNFAFNPLTQPFFAEQLSTQVAQNLGIPSGSNLQQNIQNSLLQAAVNTSSFAGSNTFFNNVETALGNNGITGEQASNVLAATQGAYFAPAFSSRVDFRNGLQQSLINQGFDTNSALQVASSLTGVSPQATSNVNIPINNINSQLLTNNLNYNLGVAGVSTNSSDIATRVISSLLANTQEVAEATFQADLQHQLVVEGLNQEVASRVAAGTVIPTTNSNNPLSSSVTTNIASQADLHAQIQASLTDIYSPLLTQEQAKTHAKHLADLLIGPANANAEEISEGGHPQSLVSTLRANIQTLRNLNDQTYFNTAMDNFKDYLKPSVDLYTFNQNLLDPGKKILYANKAMYAQSSTGSVKIGGTLPSLQVAV